MPKSRPYQFPFHNFITIISIITTLATIYAFAPFIPHSITPTATVNLPYLNSQPSNLSIQLPTRTLNPYTTPQEPLDDRLTFHSLQTQNQNLYLVQFKQTVTLSDLSVLAYFPTNTYLIRSNPNQIRKLALNPLTNFIDYYVPEYKLTDQLITNLPIQDTQKIINLTITIDPTQSQDSLTQQILNIDPQATIQPDSNSSLLTIFQIQINESNIIELARLPQIILIQ